MSDERRAWEAIERAEQDGRRYCAEMQIERKTALVECWALATARKQNKKFREILGQARLELEPLARAIISPKGNSFRRAVDAIDEVLE